MISFIIASILTGLLFGILDALINANPIAVKLLECYKPIAKQKINVPAGLIIDFLYGFAISGLFIFLFPILPTDSGVLKGIVFGIGMWFFRVLMNAFSSWMMFKIPIKTLFYILLTGLLEMMILGIVNGLIINR